MLLFCQQDMSHCILKNSLFFNAELRQSKQTISNHISLRFATFYFYMGRYLLNSFVQSSVFASIGDNLENGNKSKSKERKREK